MPNLQMPEIILLVLVVVLLFGAKKLPDTARGLGRSLRIFKAETKGLRDDEKEDAGAQSQAAPQAEPRQISATETSQPGSAQAGAAPAGSPEQPPAATPPASGQPPAASPDPDADRR